MRKLAVNILYYIGEFFCYLCDSVAHDFPRAERTMMFFHRIYGFFMWHSSELDKYEVVWVKRRPGETDEEFEFRCKQRYPENFL